MYIAARSKERANKAIEAIKMAAPNSRGALVYLHLDLSDLTTIKASADEFLAAEKKLHVLFNNAGVQCADGQAKTAQGYEMNLGVNCIGTFMFTKLLTQLLVSTAKSEEIGSVRVIWLSSNMDLAGFKDTGLPLDNLDYRLQDYPPLTKYGYSKAGDYLYGVEYAGRHKHDGVVSVPVNPGNLWSELYRDQAASLKFVAKYILCSPPIYGAYTELFAGLSPDINIGNSGSWGKLMGSGFEGEQALNDPQLCHLAESIRYARTGSRHQGA